MAYADGGSELHGVGGWMYLFLFGFGFVGLLAQGYAVFAMLTDPQVKAVLGANWTAYVAVESVLATAALALIATVVWRLYNRQNPATVRLTIAAIPIIALGVPLLDIAITLMFVDAEPSAMFGEIAPDLLRGAIYCGVWCSYFNVSKRVASTYYSEPMAEEAAVFE